MKVLFIHPNFPAQFWHISKAMAQMGNEVFYLTMATNGNRLGGVNLAIYKREGEMAKDGQGGAAQPYLKPVEEAVIDGVSVAHALVKLRDEHHFAPDVIVAHTGWGSTMYCKDVYPDVPLIGYFEWYYNAVGADVGSFPGEKVSLEDKIRLRTRDAFHLVNLEACDVRFTPTMWQRSQFPAHWQEGMQVIHEGIDTEFCRPQAGRKLVLKKAEQHEALDLSKAKEIVTYVSRGLEPYRGYPQMISAAAILTQQRPGLHVVIVGMDQTCYGTEPGNGQTWKQYMDDRVKYDKKRVHFVGHLDREAYRMVLQASTVHVYYTRPFILSWSMLEAMSCGCALVASRTQPVEEVVRDGENGLLANFRSPEHLAMRVAELLDDPERRQRLGKAARQTILDRYDMHDCVKKQINMIYGAMK